MKKLKLTALLLLAVSLAFTSCKDDEPEKPNDPNDKNGFLIEGKDFYGILPAIDSVHATVFLYNASGEQLEEVILDRAAFVNKSFKLYVPNEMTADYLINPVMGLAGEENAESITVTNPSAKISAPVNINVYNKGKLVGIFVLYEGSDIVMEYMYSTAANTMTGDVETTIMGMIPMTVNFNVAFKQGWNLLASQTEVAEDFSWIKTSIFAGKESDSMWRLHDPGDFSQIKEKHRVPLRK